MTGALAACLAFSGPAQAQVGAKPALMHPRGDINTRPEAEIDLRQTYPALAPVKMGYIRPNNLRNLPQTLNRPNKSRKGATPPSLLGAPAPIELWGNAIYQTTWGEGEPQYGYYAFSTAAPISSINALGKDPDMIFNAGCGIVNGVLHGVFLDTSLAVYGIIKAYHLQFDPETWERVAPSKEVQLHLAAFETAQDPTTGEIYGEFYDAQLQQREFGVIDFEKETRTTFGKTDKSYVALGLSTDGFLYGIASDGYLYKIDKTNGKETQIGSTGVTLLDEDGSYSGQSGEIDAKTNTFYWTCVDAQQNAALYTVDLKTGAATKISDFPNNDMFVGLIVPKPKAAEGAPAAAEEMAANFTGASLTGKIDFKVPTKTFGGSTLSGNVTYNILQGKNTLATGTAQAGEEVSANVTVEQEGLVRFTLRLENAAGHGPYTYVEKWIGYDEPRAIENAHLDINNETGAAKLTWSAPTATLHEGYLGTLTYDVMRYPDSVMVVTNGSATEFAETLTKGEMTYYSYGIWAHNGTQKSAQAYSNGAVLGDSVSLPYLEEFKTPASMNLFKIIDVNNDGQTWVWNPYGKYETGAAGQAATYYYNPEQDADDWMLTPPVSLKKDHIYHFAFKTKSRLKRYKERLEVKFGKGDQIEDMSNEILAPTEISTDGYVTFEKDLSIDADGKYRIGFHALSPQNQLFLYIDSISIGNGIAFSAPDSVQDLAITPNPQAEKKATLTFKTPTKDLKGQPLSGLFRFTIEREGKGVVKEVEYPARGKQYTFEDEVTNAGIATYTITCFNKNGEGRKLTKTVYIGLDAPQAPEGGRLSDRSDNIGIEWDAVSSVGQHGGVVLPQNVIYRIYNISYDSQSGKPTPQFLTETMQTSYNVSRNTAQGPQQYIIYGLSAKNATGDSPISFTRGLVVGAPYALPIKESVVGGELSMLWWHEHSGKSTFGTTSDRTIDKDGGAFKFSADKAGDDACINSGKISVQGAKHPRISFYHFAEPAKPIRLELEIRKADNTLVKVGQFDYAPLKTVTDWNKFEYDLDKNQFAGEPYLQFRIRAVADKARVPVWVDKIMMYDAPDHDLNVSITAPEVATKGETIPTAVRVKNIGAEPIQAYKVRLKAGGELVQEIASEKALPVGESCDFTIDYKTNVLSNDEAVTLKVEVVCKEDPNTDDNFSEATTTLKDSDLPQPENVTANLKSGQDVQLNWQAPATLTRKVTENFENYAPWTINNFGDWTGIDGDGGNVGGFWKSHPYKHQGTPFAFITFNPENLFAGCTESNPILKPHSGEQYLTAIYSTKPGETESVDADNWLISPMLSGEAQQINFWVNNYKSKTQEFTEQIEILYSTTDRQAKNFQKVGKTRQVSGGKFQNIKADLPQGAKYFAIRHITGKDNVCIFMLDDVTFVKGYAKPKGYNVYRDGKLVASLNEQTMTVNDKAETEGVHRYAITAIYDKGESKPVWIDVTTAIQLIEALSGQPLDVYAADGRLIGKALKRLPQLAPGVYIINGKKVVIK